MTIEASYRHPIMDTLEPAFKETCIKVLLDCAELGVQMRPFFGRRSPLEQAKLWRQGRTIREINEATKMLDNEKAYYLSDQLKIVGPQHGRQVTNALPGNSWHQYGQALDCFWTVNGKAEWSLEPTIEVKGTDKNGIEYNGQFNGYGLYATIARGYGLTPGYFWKMRDAVHIQSSSISAPRSMYSWEEIDEMCRKYWEGK